MRTSIRWAAATLAAVLLLAGGWFTSEACAEPGSGEFGSVDINQAILGFMNHAQDYHLDSEWVGVEIMDIGEHCDVNVLDYVARLALDENGDFKLAEVLARSLGLPSTGTQFSDEDEKYIAALSNLDAHELKVMCGLKDYIGREYEAWKAGETIAPTPEPTIIPPEKQDPMLTAVETGESVRWIIAEADAIGCLLEAYFRSENKDVQEQAVGYFNMLSVDEQIAALAYLYKRMEQDAYAEFIAWLAAGYLASDLETAGLTALTQDEGLIVDPSANMQDTISEPTSAPVPTETPAPTATPAPITEEEAKELGDYLMSKLGQDDQQQQQELTAWFLSLSIADQNAVMAALRNSLDRDSYTEFSTWLIAVFESECTQESLPVPDTLMIGGKNWNELTLPGLPAPAQGRLQTIVTVNNDRAGRQVVLGQVTQETFENWMEQIPQGSAGAPDGNVFAGDADTDGSVFDSNFGTSFAADLQDSEGNSATYYYLQPGEDGNAEVRVDYLYTDQVLSVAVLDP